jgi:hypothetical protein
MHIKTNEVWLDVYWDQFENAEKPFLSFKFRILSVGDIKKIKAAVDMGDVQTVCELWDKHSPKI